VSADEQVPAPVVDLAIDGVLRLPPSRDARRDSVALATILAALLLHATVVALFLANWQGMSSPPLLRPLQVTLVREPPKPPPPTPPKKPEPPKPQAKAEPPKPKAEAPKPKPEPEKPKPVEAKKPPPPPPVMKPRESGPDDKTEAAKSDKPKSELPKALPIQPEAPPVAKPPPEPEPPAPKPTPPKVKVKENAAGHTVMVPLAMLPPALQLQRPAAPPIRNLVLRLPGPGGGTGERDRSGDAYLNRLRDRLERNRIYPSAEYFEGAGSRNTVFSVVIEPSGAIVTVTLLASTGVSKLDEAAREIITNSEPFPRLPPDYPQMRTVITVFLPIFPAK
jgi:TonB family protein